MGYVSIEKARTMDHEELVREFIETQTMAAAAIAEALTIGGNASEQRIMERYEQNLARELREQPARV